MLLLRVVGYFLAMAAVDLAVDSITEMRRRRMEREFKQYTNDSDGEVTAHVVTEDTAGTVMTVGGTSRDVSVGDVLIGTDRPDVYHVADSSALDGYSEQDNGTEHDADMLRLSVEDSDQPADVDLDSHSFDPQKHNASDVKAYLRKVRDAGDRAEFDRVTEAEKNGYNRSSALDGDYDR